ncbi:MAG: SPASM domain-containing protein [Rhodospirillales bacterium]|nr:SPASM domain-containing protein [Alphaproteobacteria bacterium]MBL6948877.1 SPASM domain-containing protein [Rhodospirillales bacterium]
MTLTEATRENLRRKSGFIDEVHMMGDIPLFSWIDISITELCNRACSFCPRVDPDDYPNQNLHASNAMIRRIADELKQINYQGGVVFCGYGEPLLHPELINLCRAFDPKTRLEIVTNGDRLTSEMVKELQAASVNCLVVSMYDGPHQIEHFKKIFDESGVDEDFYILRDRWHSKEDEFGLKLTNRAGTVHVGDQPDIDPSKPCFYLHYGLAIDWNGDVLLCVQDWNKKVKFGNVHDSSLLEIWRSAAMQKYRFPLGRGERKLLPCSQCNADGTLHGHNHVEAWEKGADYQAPEDDTGTA